MGVVLLAGCADNTAPTYERGVMMGNRTRNYATVVYPESAPADWKSILAQQFVPAFVSPLHDNDVNPDGERKKEHYHVIIMFDSVKTIEQALEIFQLIGGVGCEVVKSIRGYARYLCHMDNPEKAQYEIDNVFALCGADYCDVISLPTDRYKIISDIMDYCDENKVYSYSTLIYHCRKHKYDWFRVLCDSGTYVVMEYLRSKAWTDGVDLKKGKNKEEKKEE